MIVNVIWTSLLVLSTLTLAVLSLPTTSITEEVNNKDDFNPEMDDDVPADRYLTHEEMITWLQSIARRYPNKAKTFSIGKSEEGRDLLVLELSHSVGRGERDLLMPMVKLVGNIHGNEVVGRQLLLRTISHLIQKDNVDPRVTRLLNTTDIFFLPSMNPDGFVKAREGDCWSGGPEGGRLNAKNIDLNRDFPDPLKPEDKLLRSQSELLQNRAAETQALIQWIKNNPFVLSASLHGGAVVASYPYDGSGTDQVQGFYSASPDDKVFRKLSQDYADRHPLMKKADTCGVGFADGITNGARWYDLKGGMQDFNYRYSNSFEITLELSCCKYAPASDLPVEWDHNRKPLLNYIASTHRGVRGLIIDKDTKRPIRDAYVHVLGIDKNITSTERGEYWRLLSPGRYTIQSFAEGYIPSASRSISITDIYTEQVNFELESKLPKKTISRLVCN
ncbi:carboxypeptidase D-like [Daphnia carinata]|uniref:carboxypeptidase D-like n=1 Tax=Daphnia carinata TaxID=120202 RepID=UPI00257C0651|nr:carboxypeptidase D-like [Daphnia carinata]